MPPSADRAAEKGVRLDDVLTLEERRVHLDEQGVLMSPDQAAVARYLDILLTSDLPDLGARWLAAGHDTPALRELAGHPHSDAWGVEHLWNQVVLELSPGKGGGTPTPEDVSSAWLRVVPVQLARWRCGEISAVNASESLLRAGWYSPTVTSLAGLDALFWLEEFAVEESSDPMRLDHQRVALLSVLADDVVLG